MEISQGRKRVLIIYHLSQIYFDGISGIFEISTGNLPGGFQITVSTRHPIKTVGEEDLAKLENKLYFVVPSLIYQKFPRQTAPRSIEQYALEMPVEVWIKEANTIMDDATTMSDVVPSG